ncbi:DUF4426 domain-containing protein [Pseudoxanthomonas sp. UTMC 1351]|uniref:DUF4426 domain-containing protein n=1 Tax=Pseudoxanthomonas sp. UTMC 1351 TaxID=2695853 RepID=UPI0034CF7EFE
MKITAPVRRHSLFTVPRSLLFRNAAFLILSAWSLAACSNTEAPRAANFVPAAPAHNDFGDLRVRYNALPTMSLSEEMAKQYGVERDTGTALVVIALRQLKNGEEVDTDGEVTGQVSDISGARQPIVLRTIDTGDYTDHIGTVRVSQRNTYRFDVTIAAGGRKDTLQFQRNF